jgi:pilus assembly protein CpaE
MVASNVAVALATTHTGETVVVDLDCVFGDIASVLGMVPEHTIGQLASLPNFDSATLKVFLGRHEQSGLHVLAGSGLPEEGEAVTDKLVGQIIQMLARDFAYVVIDTAAGLDERALAAVEHSTDVVLLASMDVTSIRNLAKEINTLDRLDMVEQRRHFILNRADTRVGLEVSDVESVIGMKVDAALPSSRLVPLSMNQGTLVVLEESESAVAQQLCAFASRFTPETSGPNPSSTSQARQRRSWFRRR